MMIIPESIDVIPKLKFLLKAAPIREPATKNKGLCNKTKRMLPKADKPLISSSIK